MTTPAIPYNASGVVDAANALSRDHIMVLPPFDEHTFHVSQIILRLPLMGLLSVLGVVTNIVNVFVFYRQGLLADSSTVTLTGLAVADGCTCLVSGWASVCMGFHLLTDTSLLRWDVFQFFLATAIRPKLLATQISCWVTAYLAFERFVSVMFPFKVKSIFTAKSSCIATTCIFLVTFALYIPNTFRALPSQKKLLTKNNITITKLTFQDSSFVTEDVSQFFTILNPIVLHTFSIIIVVFFNFTIFWKVNLSQKFRTSRAVPTKIKQSTKNADTLDKTSSEKTDTGTATRSTKDAMLLRMITLTCSVFIICYLPDVVLVFLFYAGLELQFHFYTHETLYAAVHILELINSSTNIFIYYNMSTRFRKELRRAIFKGKE